MKTLILSVILTLASAAIAVATTDYDCMIDCTDAGHQYGYCKSLCSY